MSSKSASPNWPRPEEAVFALSVELDLLGVENKPYIRSDLCLVSIWAGLIWVSRDNYSWLIETTLPPTYASMPLDQPQAAAAMIAERYWQLRKAWEATTTAAPP